MQRRLLFIFLLAFLIETGWARDEKSISGLRDALISLAPTVDPAEAAALSRTAYAACRDLAREYGMVWPPMFHNFLIHIGLRKRGYCYDWGRDLGAELKDLHLKTLQVHWGAAFAGTQEENNCLVITGRHQRFGDGIVIDAWRKGGHLWWTRVSQDRKYLWKEDVAETALLQNHATRRRKANTTTAKQ